MTFGLSMTIPVIGLLYVKLEKIILRHIAPHLAVEIYEAHRRGDAAAARAAQARFSPLRLAMVGTPPGAVKAAMTLAGVPVGPSRSPIGPLTAEQKKTIAEVLQTVGEPAA